MAPRRSAHLVRRRRTESANEVAQIIIINDSLKEESRTCGTKQNAKSHQRPGQPGATQARYRSSQGLPRPPFETFPLRERRDDEGQVLGLPRSQNAQTDVP